MPDDTTTTETTATTEAADKAASVASGTEVAGAVASAAATTPAEVVYDLKLPDGATFAPDFVTRTADTARVLGLTNEAGQKLLDAQIAEVTTATTAAVAAAKAEQLTAMQPGGAVWTEQEKQWRTDALADKEIGGSPEKVQASVDLAMKVMGKFSTPATAKFFTDSGLGSHPELVRLLSRIGRQMSEASLVVSGGSTSGASTYDERLAKLYPTMAAK